MLRVVFVIGRAGNMNRLPVRADNLQTCGARIDGEHGPGLQRCVEHLAARVPRLSESGNLAGKQSRTCNGTERSHVSNYAGYMELVPSMLSLRSHVHHEVWLFVTQSFEGIHFKSTAGGNNAGQQAGCYERDGISRIRFP